MRYAFLLLLSCFAYFAQGCAVYDGVAYFHDSGELLEVKIDKHLDSKKAYVEARGTDGLICSGALRTTHPVNGWLQWWTCKGEFGKFLLACNDGRHLFGVWNAENCSNGNAGGTDQYGNTFVLAYGDRRDDMLFKIGAGPSQPRKSFYNGPAGPLYSNLLGYDGDEGLMPVLNAPQSARAKPGSFRTSTGIFVSTDGRIVTSSAGLSKDDALSVYLPAAQSEVPASVLSIDPEDDIATLIVEAEGSIGSAVQVIIRKKLPQSGTGHYRPDYR